MNVSQHNHWNRHDAAWRDLVWAMAGAVVITLLLAGAVFVVWSFGRSPAGTAAVIQEIETTPTPRALVFENEVDAPAAEPAATNPPDPTAIPTPVATQQVLAMSSAGAPGPVDSGPVFEASSEADFARLASGSWTTEDNGLFNDGTIAVAEPWLPLASPPGGSFAIEAEIRVDGLLETVCDQSFGLVAGDPGASTVYGAGLLFPCSGTEPLARLTDVAIWEDGYNVDPVLAEKSFDPGQAWHTYRFEIRGGRLRLIIDGVAVVSSDVPTPLDSGSPTSEVGIWSQGAAIDVRRATVVALPS